jgi:protein TonB
MEKQQQNIRSWDDLIFENRNKAYGAYTIRQSYDEAVIKGLATTIGIAAAIIVVAGFIGGNKIIEKVIAVSPTINIGPPPKIQTETVVPAQRIEPVKRVNPNLAVQVVTTPDPVKPDPQPSTASTGTQGTTDGTTGTDTGTSGGADTGTDLGTVPVKNNEPFIHVEVMPTYKGGMEGMMKTLKKNMRYPASARRMGKEGTVFVEFVVTEFGDIENIKVVKGFDLDCDKEAVRIVGKLTEWNPGMQNKMEVNVKLVLPIKFKLEQ